MPQAGPALTAFWSALGAIAANQIVRTILINIALGYLAKKLAKRNKADLPPINVTLRGTVEPRHIILGTCRAGGVLSFYSTTSSGGSTSDLLWYVIIYAGHQVSSMSDVWIDTHKIANADINVSTGEVGGSGRYAGKVWIWRHLGTGGQTVDSNLDAAFAEVTADTRLRGCAYSIFKFKRDSVAFQSAPQNVTMLIDGALVYDPRLDSTNGGSGLQRAENPSTWAFSRNPALHAQWFLTGGSVVNDQSTRMVKYGLRESYTRIPPAYVVAAANVCDETISGANAPPSGSQPRYRCDIEFTCGETRRDILNAILESMAGGATVHGGQWRIYAGAYDTPTHTLDQTDLYGDLEIQDTTPHTDRYNAVFATFIDASKQYVESTTPLRTDSAYETQDGGEQITKELDLRAVTDQYQAQRLCEIDLRRSRMMRTARLVGMLNLLKVAPWETLTYSHARYGWTNRVFRCVEWQFEYAEEAARVSLTCRREDSGVYADMVTADYTTGTSATDVFQGDGPDTPTGLTVTTFPGFVRINVGLPSYLAAGSVVEIWEHTSSTPFSSATKIFEGLSDTFDIAKRDTTGSFYWARIRDKRGAVSGTYPASTGQSGAADLATDVSSVTDAGPITSTLTAPAASAGYQVKYIEIAVTDGWTVEVSASFRAGVSTAAAPGTWSVQLYALAGSGSFPNTSCGQALVKDTTAYEMVSVIGHHTPAGGGTFRYGIGAFITGNGTNNFDAIVRDMTVRVTVVKR